MIYIKSDSICNLQIKFLSTFKKYSAEPDLKQYKMLKNK